MIWLFGVLVVIPLAVNYAACRVDYQRHMDAFMLASMLCVFWAVTNSIGMLWEFPESKKFHSLIDLLGLLTCVASYVTARRRWKAYLALIFLVQLGAHAAFWWAYDGNTAGSIAYAYKLTLNLTWLAQLVCVGASGGVVVFGGVIDHLRNRWGHRNLGGA